MNKPKHQISVHMAVSIIVGVYVPLVVAHSIWDGPSMIVPYISMGAFFGFITGLIAIVPVTYAYRREALRKNLDGIAGLSAVGATLIVNLILDNFSGVDWLPLTFNVLHLSATLLFVAFLVNRSRKMEESKKPEAVIV